MSQQRSPSLSQPGSPPASHPPGRRDTERFLLAAKGSEIVTLQSLAKSCQVVASVSELIHALQRERGLSNIYLASRGERFGEPRRQQADLTRVGEQRLRTLLEEHYLDGGLEPGRVRLFSSIAFVLQGLDDLPELRRQVEDLRIDAPQTTRALSRLIAGLLSVVFEAADVAADPTVTRALVALFNFMQGKEQAGQERAWGAIGFATGGFDDVLCERLVHLQESQQRSFATFSEFAPSDLQGSWREIETGRETRELTQLREMISRLGRGETIAPEISEVWYDLATRRIDRMRGLEDRLAAALLELGERQVARARRSLTAHHQRLQALAASDAPPASPLTLLLDPPAAAGAGAGAAGLSPDLARSVYDLVRGQSEHLKRMSEELNDARRALTERKQIERAKGLLMQSLGLSEEQAYHQMRRRAMERNIRLADMADTLIRAANPGQE